MVDLVVSKKLRSSGLVIFGTLLIFTLLGLLTGSLAIGIYDIALILLVIVVGLVIVWRPRRNNSSERV